MSSSSSLEPAPLGPEMRPRAVEDDGEESARYPEAAGDGSLSSLRLATPAAAKISRGEGGLDEGANGRVSCSTVTLTP